MLEYGQPVHAYDLRDIKKHIHVRLPKKAETLKTLDEKQITLEQNDILICDQKKPIGLAGIMGGANSEVKHDTTDIILEVAHFSPQQIRKTSKRLSLHTEASHRFERGIDITNISFVIKRLAHFIDQSLKEINIHTAEIASQMIDVYPSPAKKSQIALRLNRTKKILGIALYISW